MTLESALEQLLAIQALPRGYRDPARIDPDSPHLCEPWIPLPAALIEGLQSLLRRLQGEGLPIPSFLDAIPPYLGNGGVAVDPGFGFGKRIVDNLALLKHLSQLSTLGVALAVGLSRKSMLSRLTGRGVDDRLAGSVALAAIAVLHGARIVRAHDVAATVDAVRVAAAVAQGVDFDAS